MKIETNLEAYNYNLPQKLIAKNPIYPKSKAKLLVYKKNEDKVIHTSFKYFFDFIPKDCLIVLNDTKVLPARIYGKKQSGAKIELLYHKTIKKNKFLVQIKGKVKVNDILEFDDNLICNILELKDNGLRIVEFYKNNKLLDSINLFKILESIGHTPLPPYIKRKDDINDRLNYQSVFAKNLGSIAAPTASLHFSKNDINKIKKLNHCFITLHIGAGTFFNVEADDITKHKIHKEDYFISDIAKEKIDNAKKILCIGTTATRCVEYYTKTKILNGECDIFIHPLNPPLKTKYLLTNFHLPKSTLLMLVSSFIGLSKTKSIYEIAKENQYRFYSYGDGMLII
ncbi:tRNA preQ1(34) S-adenosylmethionine ribosyltransferase-isomerase QueA [Helicobacter sp. MIT 14-3879]|uniref:tRNA preQ1(34) S-adenosylmethionine ribosyltransferase-isomerase QueA n=1 Tax=Helicobacter sp. MIT 14-3879 TaxID=2040649 RepID=UPI000E1F0C7C|nr:tRNA preQ1(34) S-adenosylmethionine ribosyltransferase-isomerase QueA [Helicobacter sp. MIT 14-3879]RDU62869.1 tRNA preQ1(34) S-adenosylmethionine ribosyltransferase-isomerase QueA [Helicobacter sp. MIT 14-3879]